MKQIDLSTLTKPKYLAPIVFVAIGGRKAYKDYVAAEPDKKNKTLIKDTTVLLSSATGYAASIAVLKKIPNVPVVETTTKLITLGIKSFTNKKFVKEKITPIYKKIIKPQAKISTKSKFNPQLMHNSLLHIEKAVKDCMSATFITISAIIAAFAGNELICRTIIKQSKEELEKKKEDMKKNAQQNTSAKEHTASSKANYNYLNYINKEFSKDPANKVFASMSFLPVMRALDFPMTAVQGFEINKINEFSDRIKKTSYSLIANAIVPTFFISIATAVTKQWKDYVKYPFIAFSTLIGMAFGMGIGKYTENKIENNMHLK